MAVHFGASSPTVICRNVSAEKPTANEIECCNASDCICIEASSGDSNLVNKGWPTQPNPRLAIVMPNWVALR